MLLTLLAILLGADFISGLYHWIEQRYFDEQPRRPTRRTTGPTRSRSRLVRGLQEFGLIQSPRHHAGHHQPPYLTRYCTLTDYLNPVLDRLHVWRWAEWLVEKCFGIKVYNT